MENCFSLPSNSVRETETNILLVKRGSRSEEPKPYSSSTTYARCASIEIVEPLHHGGNNHCEEFGNETEAFPAQGVALNLVAALRTAVAMHFFISFW
jgi:hypothetical protein